MQLAAGKRKGIGGGLVMMGYSRHGSREFPKSNLDSSVYADRIDSRQRQNIYMGWGVEQTWFGFVLGLVLWLQYGRVEGGTFCLGKDG